MWQLNLIAKVGLPLFFCLARTHFSWSYLLSLRHLFAPSFLFFAILLPALLRLLVEHSHCPLLPLVHLSFYLSHLHFASLSNELKSSHILFSHLTPHLFPPPFRVLSIHSHAPHKLAHFSCEIKAAFLVCNHNAIAPLSHPLCTSIAVLFNPFLKTSSV